MSLSNLTTSGWFFLAFTILTLANLVSAFRAEGKPHAPTAAVPALVASLCVAWSLWLLTGAA